MIFRRPFTLKLYHVSRRKDGKPALQFLTSVREGEQASAPVRRPGYISYALLVDADGKVAKAPSVGLFGDLRLENPNVAAGDRVVMKSFIVSAPGTPTVIV